MIVQNEIKNIRVLMNNIFYKILEIGMKNIQIKNNYISYKYDLI